jgi:hypothetical protein
MSDHLNTDAENRPDRRPEDTVEPRPEPDPASRPETPAERRRRRAAFLRELDEAKELQARVHPRRTKNERMRQALRMRTFRS